MPLTTEQNEAWRSLVLLTHVLDDALDTQTQADGGLPHAYYKVLVFLYEAPDRRLTMAALARAQRYSPSRLTHAVKSMEKSGWLSRSVSESDGRVRIVQLTAEGIQLVRRVSPGQVRQVRERVFANLSDAQVGQLTAIGAKVIAALDA
ncbi:MarR family transcriptional regulator [Glaciihabitans arcticus]|uniref:MarR family transcriptional regulator n=1 Tax=Glaciihabitans arcticus TaxID=2668039 RepID=A0A4Q9GYY6_9MICO|nr:MarR family transcriptional regulator [Glaciihabitans arcticus]TBN58033.1 MarR family transcriptional regulator [Glaciihabitans arcticus]